MSENVFSSIMFVIIEGRKTILKLQRIKARKIKQERDCYKLLFSRQPNIALSIYCIFQCTITFETFCTSLTNAISFAQIHWLLCIHITFIALRLYPRSNLIIDHNATNRCDNYEKYINSFSFHWLAIYRLCCSTTTKVCDPWTLS